MARFCTLFSSSSGNSEYIGNASGGILIDAGINAKQLTLALARHEIAPESIRAVFVTHEHSDHIGALRVFASRYSVPVYCSEGTGRGISAAGQASEKYQLNIMPKNGLSLESMYIKAFRTSHDSRESTGYTVNLGDRKIAVVTDTGIITDEIMTAVQGCDLVLMESNHDLDMLNYGPYPPELKRRIRSDLGHLSNNTCAETLTKLIDTGTSRFVLGHLSKENNLPELAYNTSLRTLTAHGATQGLDFLLSVAPAGTMERMMIF